jgi:glycosyltransferase involved in cell wall biosynthesis
MTERILCSLPALPDRTTGGGVFLYETLIYLLTRGPVHACLPVPRHLHAAFTAIRNDPALVAVEWHLLTETQVATRFDRAYRLLSPTPVEVLKFSTPANQAILEETRRALAPTAEILISSRALAPYRDFALPLRTRLYMMDIDPRIVRYDGPSWKRRLMTRLEQPKVERLCRKALATAGRVGAISQGDVSELNRMGRRHDVRYVPPLMRPHPANRNQAKSFHVLITTNFSYHPNVEALQWFLQTCWPHVDSRAFLTVTGIDPNGSLRHLCDGHERVTYAGCLPGSQLEDLYGKVSLAVNPTRTGSGFQIKLLDALARGVPIVSTAFSNRIGAAIPSSDDPEELARLINARLTPGTHDPFDYHAFYREATAAWDRFLFGE